ncbi:MAG TPA: helix-turn-helix transcriptional regulator [Methylomirabilota bacterium]|nr:helix-turn-helix transcriptional regulator [Methylomirabilota bacterium]
MTGARLRQIREQLGLRQEHMAALLGVHRQTLNRYENGRLAIPVPVAKIAQMVAPLENRVDRRKRSAG